MIGLGSTGESGDASSSYLGELKGVCWAFEDAKRTRQGQKLILCKQLIVKVYIRDLPKLLPNHNCNVKPNVMAHKSNNFTINYNLYFDLRMLLCMGSIMS